ncbi:MAG: hypothetical protein JXR46_04295 [Calditrichaceae bacterium]|nr:hypothetical protein [Calditrichaceae bacterium]MBN2708247.1 hypothetical protein [Calditrichaceae bacterium]RQV92269.1 MAG: hypothetical protein EH224_16180 [Calditrichota bacterium]
MNINNYNIGSVLPGYIFFSNEEWERFEERAAIMEYDSEMSREEAENLAYCFVLAEREQLKIAG